MKELIYEEVDPPVIDGARVLRMVERNPEIFPKATRPRCSKGIPGCMKVHPMPVLDWDAADWEELASPKGMKVWQKLNRIQATQEADEAHTRNLRRAVTVAVGLGAVVGLWLLLHSPWLPVVWR